MGAHWLQGSLQEGGSVSGSDSRRFLMDKVGRSGIGQGSSGCGDSVPEGIANGLLHGVHPSGNVGLR